MTDTPKLKRRWLRPLLFVLLVLVFIWVVEFACGFVLLWSRLRCWRVDVDVNSGLIRSGDYLAELCIAEVEGRGIDLSRVASKGVERNPPEWHISSISSPLVPRPPYYSYQGAAQHPGWLQALWAYGNFTAAAKQETARNILLLWKRDRGSHSADLYLSELEALCFHRSSERSESQAPIDTKDLPPLPPAR